MGVLESLINESDRLDMMKNICKTMLEIHKKKILHGNLKLSNILLNEENEMYVSDISQYLLYLPTESEKYKCKKEIHNYLSPNILKGKQIDFYDDIWSFCCILYRLVIIKKDAFEGKSINELINNIINVRYEPLKFENPFVLRNILFVCFNMKDQVKYNFEWIYNELLKIGNGNELYSDKCDLDAEELLMVLEGDKNELNKKYILNSINENEGIII